LIHLRTASPALVEGDYRSIEVGDSRVFGFIRETSLQRFMVVLNFGADTLQIDLKGQVGAWVAGTHLVQGDGLTPEHGKVSLEAYEGRVYEFRQGEDDGSRI
jgi:hypothetical protein